MTAPGAGSRPLPTDGPAVSVVIPLYNEEDTVADLLSRARDAVRRTGLAFEIVAVNDGSTDGTLTRLLQAGRSLPELRILDLHRNFGHMNALAAGIDAARGAAVATLDGDLQDPPEILPDLVAAWRDGADVVLGLRTKRREPFLQRAGTALFHWFLWRITRTRIPRDVGTCGLMDRRVVEALKAMPERERYFAGLRAWVGGRQAVVPYARAARARGKSRVGPQGLVRLARTALVSFSKMPLRLVSLMSLAAGLSLFVVGSIAVLVRLFTDRAIPGWATFTTLIGFMGFTQAVALATLAEYVAVIFDEVKMRPLYLVRREIRGDRPIGPDAER